MVQANLQVITNEEMEVDYTDKQNVLPTFTLSHHDVIITLVIIMHFGI